VAVDKSKENVREFGVYSKDDPQMITNLKNHIVTTVAMESTGGGEMKKI